MLSPSQTLTIPAGTHAFNEAVWIDGANDIKIVGAGIGATVLDYSKLKNSSQAWHLGGCKKVVLEGFTLRNVPSDGLRLQDCANITLKNVAVEWTDRSSSGAYGIFAVSSKQIQLDACEVSGAVHGGVVAVRCEGVEIARCKAYKNVIGFSIENSKQVQIFDCVAENNSIGIAALQLPMPAPCEDVFVFHNHIHANNLNNFAAEGDLVAALGSGIGVIALSAQNIHIAQNTIEDNVAAGIVLLGQASLPRMGIAAADKTASRHLLVHDNAYKRNGKAPAERGKLGLFLTTYVASADVVYDGTASNACISEAAEYSFSLLQMQQINISVSHDTLPFQCNPQAFLSAQKP